MGCAHANTRLVAVSWKAAPTWRDCSAFSPFPAIIFCYFLLLFFVDGFISAGESDFGCDRSNLNPDFEASRLQDIAINLTIVEHAIINGLAMVSYGVGKMHQHG